MQNPWDIERDALRKHIVFPGIHIDAGCGGRKIDRRCIGVDVVPKGKKTHLDLGCVADICDSVGNLHIHFEDNSVDSVVMNHVGHLFFDPHADTLRMFQSVSRVLKAGGVFGINDIISDRWMDHGYSNWPHHFWTVDEYESFGHVFGFNTVEKEITVDKAGPKDHVWSERWVGKKIKKVPFLLQYDVDFCEDARIRKDWSICYKPEVPSKLLKSAWEKGLTGPVWIGV